LLLLLRQTPAGIRGRGVTRAGLRQSIGLGRDAPLVVDQLLRLDAQVAIGTLAPRRRPAAQALFHFAQLVGRTCAAGRRRRWVLTLQVGCGSAHLLRRLVHRRARWSAAARRRARAAGAGALRLSTLSPRRAPARLPGRLELPPDLLHLLPELLLLAREFVELPLALLGGHVGLRQLAFASAEILLPLREIADAIECAITRGAISIRTLIDL